MASPEYVWEDIKGLSSEVQRKHRVEDIRET